MTDTFVRALRNSLSNWKQHQLYQITQDDQDTVRLNEYLKMTSLAYNMLKNYVEKDGNAHLDSSLVPFVEVLGDTRRLSRDQKLVLQEYMFRDLIEYPFTYNTQLINSFDKTNALNTNIIPNK